MNVVCVLVQGKHYTDKNAFQRGCVCGVCVIAQSKHFADSSAFLRCMCVCVCGVPVL